MRGSSRYGLAATGREAPSRVLLGALGQESVLIIKDILFFLPKAGWAGNWEERLAQGLYPYRREHFKQAAPPIRVFSYHEKESPGCLLLL